MGQNESGIEILVPTTGRILRNAAPKSYRAKFIEPGIISYNDQGEGVVFVSREALDAMAPTFKGCPVIFVPEHHDDSEPGTAFNFGNGVNPPAGIVASDPEWEDDGWQYVNLLVWDPDAQTAIDRDGYSVSCAYMPDQDGPGGDWHNIRYDAEMMKGHYMHMAIVPRPRYEGSKILANSKGGHSVAIKIFGKKKANAGEPPKPAPAAPAAAPEKKPPEGMEKLNADPSSVVKLPDGSTATLQELIEAYKTAGPDQGGEETELDPDDQVDVDGTVVTVGELIAAYQGTKGGSGAPAAAENADPPTNTPASEVVDPAVQGPGVRTNSKPGVNAAIKNAASKPPADGLGEEHPETRTERLARGRARYSRSVTQEATK